MNGPRIVCAGCGSPTKGLASFCDNCLNTLRAMGAAGPRVDTQGEHCLLCEVGNKANRRGLHLTSSGGYMGKCTEFTSRAEPT